MHTRESQRVQTEARRRNRRAAVQQAPPSQEETTRTARAAANVRHCEEVEELWRHLDEHA